MIIDNSANGNDFKPDPFLDVERDFESRIVGVFHMGKHEQKAFESDEINEVEQAIILFELTEEETFVARGGTEEEPIMKPRTMPKFIKYSSHEKSGLFKLAKQANPKAAWIDKKKGYVNASLIIDSPLSLKVKNNAAGDKQNIAVLVEIPTKYKAGVGEAQTPQFCYSVDGGAFVGELSDVPAWMLRYALDNAVNAADFQQLEAIEDHLAALEAAKEEGAELEGDKAPTKKAADKKADTSKADAKKAADAKVKADKAAAVKAKADEAADESEAEDGPAAEEVADKPVSRPARQSRVKKDEVNYSGMNDTQLEDILIDKGLTDDDLNAMIDVAPSEAAYTAALIEKIKSL